MHNTKKSKEEPKRGRNASLLNLTHYHKILKCGIYTNISKASRDSYTQWKNNKSYIEEITDEHNTFQDHEFYPKNTTLSSLCTQNLKDIASIAWFPLQKFFQNKKFYLFNEIKLRNQTLKNPGYSCLIDALNIISLQPGLVYRLFEIKKISKEGIYAVWLNLNGRWKQIIIDEWVPIYNDKSGKSDFFLSTPNSITKEIWYCLIEKAFAKVRGGYEKLAFGKEKDLLRDLTGAPYSVYTMKTMLENRDSEGNGIGNVYNHIKKCLGRGYILSAIPKNDKKILKNGLCSNHTYGVVTVKEVESSEGKITKILKLRNPWDGEEWTGDWSSQSSSWTSKAIKELGFENILKDGGEFWISVNDFVKYFQKIRVFKVNPLYIYQSLNLQLTKNLNSNIFIVRFTIYEDGKYTFSANQHQLTNKFHHYSPIKLVIGKLEEGKFLLKAKISTKNQRTTFIREKFSKGEFFILIEKISSQENWGAMQLRDKMVLSVYGPQSCAIKLIDNGAKGRLMYDYLNYYCWKGFSVKDIGRNLSEMKISFEDGSKESVHLSLLEDCDHKVYVLTNLNEFGVSLDVQMAEIEGYEVIGPAGKIGFNQKFMVNSTSTDIFFLKEIEKDGKTSIGEENFKGKIEFLAIKGKKIDRFDGGYEAHSEIFKFIEGQKGQKKLTKFERFNKHQKHRYGLFDVGEEIEDRDKGKEDRSPFPLKSQFFSDRLMSEISDETCSRLINSIRTSVTTGQDYSVTYKSSKQSEESDVTDSSLCSKSKYASYGIMEIKESRNEEDSDSEHHNNNNNNCLEQFGKIYESIEESIKLDSIKTKKNCIEKKKIKEIIIRETPCFKKQSDNAPTIIQRQIIPTIIKEEQTLSLTDGNTRENSSLRNSILKKLTPSPIEPIIHSREDSSINLPFRTPTDKIPKVNNFMEESQNESEFLKRRNFSSQKFEKIAIGKTDETLNDEDIERKINQRMKEIETLKLMLKKKVVKEEEEDKPEEMSRRKIHNLSVGRQSPTKSILSTGSKKNSKKKVRFSEEVNQYTPDCESWLQKTLKGDRVRPQAPLAFASPSPLKNIKKRQQRNAHSSETKRVSVILDQQEPPKDLPNFMKTPIQKNTIQNSQKSAIQNIQIERLGRRQESREKTIRIDSKTEKKLKPRNLFDKQRQSYDIIHPKRDNSNNSRQATPVWTRRPNYSLEANKRDKNINNPWKDRLRQQNTQNQRQKSGKKDFVKLIQNLKFHQNSSIKNTTHPKNLPQNLQQPIVSRLPLRSAANFALQRSTISPQSSFRATNRLNKSSHLNLYKQYPNTMLSSRNIIDSSRSINKYPNTERSTTPVRQLIRRKPKVIIASPHRKTQNFLKNSQKFQKKCLPNSRTYAQNIPIRAAPGRSLNASRNNSLIFSRNSSFKNLNFSSQNPSNLQGKKFNVYHHQKKSHLKHNKGKNEKSQDPYYLKGAKKQKLRERGVYNLLNQQKNGQKNFAQNRSNSNVSRGHPLKKNEILARRVNRVLQSQRKEGGTSVNISQKSFSSRPNTSLTPNKRSILVSKRVSSRSITPNKGQNGIEFKRKVNFNLGGLGGLEGYDRPIKTPLRLKSSRTANGGVRQYSSGVSGVRRQNPKNLSKLFSLINNKAKSGKNRLYNEGIINKSQFGK